MIEFPYGIADFHSIPIRLKVPNLVVKRLFLDRLLEIFLPDPGDSYGAREAAMTFHQTGDLRPLAALFQERLLPVLSNRDRGRSPPRNGLSGGGANEMVVKSLFLSILFDDTRFVTFSARDHRSDGPALRLIFEIVGRRSRP